MRTLKYASRGADVEFLQLALLRAGYYKGKIDGIFGTKTERAVKAFQDANDIKSDGIAGAKTYNLLEPFFTGYLMHKIIGGDTIYNLAKRYQTDTETIFTANPGVNAQNLKPGELLIIPLGFSVVPQGISFTYTVLQKVIEGLCARYPFLWAQSIGKSEAGRDIFSVYIGTGKKQVMFNASHHANEWITTPVLLKYSEQYALAYSRGEDFYGESASVLFENTQLCVVPMVNPDGVALVTGEIQADSAEYAEALAISRNYPQIKFTSGWKANIKGTDLNLNYPAGWEKAKSNKYAQGYISPAPRDFVGISPLSAAESRAMYEFTLKNNFLLTLSYHSQGEIIYWKYAGYEPQNSYNIALKMQQVSGYSVELTPFESGFAGYKDWFIQQYNLPGYTIEVGLGTNPLPISDFDEIYKKNKGILTVALSSVL